MMQVIEIIKPDWPIPDHVGSACTTKIGGISEGDYQGANLGLHVDDKPEHVQSNRAQLIAQLQLPPIYWLTQTHSDRALNLDDASDSNADASYTTQTQHCCAVMTADCLPVLFYHPDTETIGAIHAGWRGLAQNILNKTLKQAVPNHLENCLVYLGPAISQAAYQVDNTLFDTFTQMSVDYADAFLAQAEKKYLLCLYTLARIQLQKLGIEQIFGGQFCSYSEQERFYSYRRQTKTGRMASLIWLKN